MSNSRRRWALGAAGALAGALLLGWAALHWLLPAWLEQRVRAALSERGVGPVALRVHAPGLGGIRVTGLRLGSAPELEVAEITLRWSPASLRRGRAEELAMRGVDWRLALREGRLDFGALAPLFEPAPAAEPAPPAAPPVLPLARASLEGLRVRVDAPSGPIEGRAALAAVFGAEGVESGRLTFEASDAGGALELHGELVLESGARIHLESSGRLSDAAALGLAGLDAGAFTLRLSGFAPVAGRAFRPAPTPAEGLVLDATLSGGANGARAEGSVEVSLQVDGERALLNAELRSLRADGIAVPGAALSANALDWTQPIPVLDSLVLSAPELRLGELALRHAQLSLHLEPGGAGTRGRLELRGEAEAPDVPAASLELGASFESDGDTLRVTGPECGRVGLAAGALGAGGWRLARPLALCLTGGAVTLHAAPDGGSRIEGAFALAPAEFRLEHRDGSHVRGTTPRLEARGSRDSRGDELRVRSAGGEVELGAARLALRGLTADVSLARSEATAPSAQLTLALDELRDLAPERRVVPLSLAGKASLEGEEVRFDATARDASGELRIGVQGAHALGSGRGHAAVELPALRLRKDGPQLEALVPLLAAWVSRVRGGLGASARLAWGRSGLDPVRLDLTLDALAADTPWLRLRGLTTTLRLDDALALSSGPRQHVRAKRIDPGLALEDAVLWFTLDEGRLSVHAFEAALAGGRLQATGRYDPAAGSGDFVLNLDALDLVRLLEGERVAGLEATGRLAGRIRAALEAGLPRSLDGRLESAPAGGLIRYRPAVPPAALAGAGAGGALALEALRDFHYERLALVLGGDAQQVQIRIELRGSSPSVENGRPIEFQLNFTGAFEQLLRAWRLGRRFEERLGRPLPATPPR